MTDAPETPPARPAPTDREARLRAALRENLRRRKAQARARQAGGGGNGDGDGSAGTLRDRDDREGGDG